MLCASSAQRVRERQAPATRQVGHKLVEQECRAIGRQAFNQLQSPTVGVLNWPRLLVSGCLETNDSRRQRRRVADYLRQAKGKPHDRKSQNSTAFVNHEFKCSRPATLTLSLSFVFLVVTLVVVASEQLE